MAGDALVTCCILLGYYVLCFITCEIAFRYMDGRKYKKVKRERKFLNALVKDYEEFSKSVELITREARQLSDADLIKDDIERVLDKKDINWISEATKVATESATPLTESFEDLRKKRGSPKWYVSVLVYTVPTVVAAFKIKWLVEQIDDNFGVKNNSNARYINTTLRESRSEVRSLDLVKSRRLVRLAADELIFSPENLMGGNPGLMHVMEVEIRSFRMSLRLLNSFMKDLQCQLKVLESEMECCWVVEAIETIEEAKDVIDIMSRAGKQRAISRWPIVSYLNNWKARRKLRKDMEYVCFRITGLLEAIRDYGIIFVRVDSSRPSDNQTIDRHEVNIDETNLSPEKVVEFICDWLHHIPETRKKLKDPLRSLHNMLQDFKGQEDSVYLVNLRNCCLEELRSICTEHMHDSYRRPSKFFSEIIVAIEKAVQLVEKCITTFSIQVTWSRGSRSAVGFEEDIDNLVLALIDKNAEHPSIICIWGMKGIGKTTLAEKVYYHKTIGDHFEVKRWISMPQLSSENLLSRNVGKQLLLEHLENPSDVGMRELVKEKKKCLLVFDNVSSIEAWNVIKPAPSEISEGSKIILITSNKALAFYAGNKSTNYAIRLRTKEESWKLFNQMVEISPDDIEGITMAKKVVDSVGGLPLGIIRLGYQLWGKKSGKKILSSVLKRINQGQNLIPWSENLKANTVELQQDQVLWKCLSYFQLFPKDAEIPTRRIVASLVASHTEIHLPIQPYQYIVKLIERGLVQIVQTKPDGNVKACRLPSPMLDILSQSLVRSKKIPSAGSSLGSTFGKNGLLRKIPASKRQNECYNKFIIFIDTREGNKPQQEIGEYLRSSVASGSFQQLQFLDLEGIFQPQMPKTIGKLKQLVYLGLRRTYLETVPSSIGNLVNLHTLDLKHTYIQSLPSLIWKLEKLQYLYLNQNCQMPQSTEISMRNLQRLSGVLVNAVNLKVWLARLINLRKLELVLQLEDPEEPLDTWIAKLTQLEVLKLRSIDEQKGPRVLKLERLSYLNELSNLYLFGRLGKPDVISLHTLPQSLKQLTLSASKLHNDPMHVLEKLPNLRSLSLFSNSYMGEELACSHNGFPQLVVLKLWNLRSLVTLQVAGAMQKLRELDIRSCSILKIPPELFYLTEKSAPQPAK